MEKAQKEKMLADITSQEDRIEKIFDAACQIIADRRGGFVTCDVEIYRAATRLLECRSAMEELAKARFMLEIENVD